jgi:quercetin dioxygenase-like cupin family protein
MAASGERRGAHASTADAVRVLVSGEETGGRFAAIVLRERRAAAAPRHRHSREDELVYILAGRVRFAIDGVTRECAAGDCVVLPRGGEHAYRVASATALPLVVVVPAGLEGYFREPGRPIRRRAGAGALERLVAAAARYGVAITGPGLPPRNARSHDE